MAARETQTKFSVENRVAIVTGAGSGINLTFASLLLAHKCNVVFADLFLKPEAQKIVDEHKVEPRALFCRTDVTNWTDLSNLFDITTKEFGTFDIVVPGAGIFENLFSNFWHPPGNAKSASTDPVDGLGHYTTLDINIVHPIRSTQLAIAEYLTPSNKGPKVSPVNPKRILHVASTSGQISLLPFPLYIASKHAILGFVKSLGPLEASLGIRVNAVLPGVVRTPLWLDHPEKLKMVDETVDDWVDPKEVADAMLSLLEDPEMKGGTMLEVGRGQTRIVPEFNNPGPSGPGHTTRHLSTMTEEVYEWLGQADWGKVVTLKPAEVNATITPAEVPTPKRKRRTSDGVDRATKEFRRSPRTTRSSRG